MSEEETFKWVDMSDDGYLRWLLVYEETDRVLATLEKNKRTSSIGVNLWALYYNGKTESFLTKDGAMTYAEGLFKTPKFKIDWTWNLKKTCDVCRGEGIIRSMTDSIHTTGGFIGTCSSCKGTGLHQEANDVSACTTCKGTGVKHD